MPGAELITVTDTTHYIQNQRPDAVVAAIREAIARTDDAPTLRRSAERACAGSWTYPAHLAECRSRGATTGVWWRTGPRTSAVSVISEWATVAVVAATGGLVSLDTMVNIAFPAITASFDIEVSEIQWLVTTYVLTFASLLLAAGPVERRLRASSCARRRLGDDRDGCRLVWHR